MLLLAQILSIFSVLMLGVSLIVALYPNESSTLAVLIQYSINKKRRELIALFFIIFFPL